MSDKVFSNKYELLFGEETLVSPTKSPTIISEVNEQFLKGFPFYLIDSGKVNISFVPKKNDGLLRNPLLDPLYDSEQIVVVSREPTKIISRIDALKLVLENTSLKNDMGL